MKQYVLSLLMISGGFAQAQDASPNRAPLKIKQIISSSQEVVAEYFGTEPLVQGTAVLATFPDQRQCALFVDRAITGHIVLNGKSCERLSELRVQQDLEFSLLGTSTAAEKSETSTEPAGPSLVNEVDVGEVVQESPAPMTDLLTAPNKRSRISDLNYLVPAKRVSFNAGVESIAAKTTLHAEGTAIFEEIRNTQSRGKIGLTLGVGDFLNLGIKGSVLFLSRTEADSIGSIESSGFEDPELGLKWRVASQDLGSPINLDLGIAYSPKMVKALTGSTIKPGNGGRGSAVTDASLTISKKFVENELLIVANSRATGKARSENAETGNVSEKNEHSSFSLVVAGQVPVNDIFYFSFGGIHNSYESYESKDVASMQISKYDRYSSAGILLGATILLEPEVSSLQILLISESVDKMKQTVGNSVYTLKDNSSALVSASLTYHF